MHCELRRIAAGLLGCRARRVHDPLDDHRVCELDDHAIAHAACDGQRLRPVAGDPHRDLGELRSHPAELELLVVPLDLSPVHELPDHAAATLELGDAHRLVPDIANRRVAATDPHGHAPVGDVVQRRIRAREHGRLARPGIRDAVPELHGRRRLRGEREQRDRLLPEDMRVVRPAVVEAVRLGVCEQLEEAARRGIGKDGDAEAQSHLRFSFARSGKGDYPLPEASADREPRDDAHVPAWVRRVRRRLRPS